MRFEGQVGIGSYGDGATQPIRLGTQGETVVTDAHSRYLEAVRRGRMFIGSTPAAGVTVPIFTNLTQQFGLANPSGSGVMAVVRKVYLGYVSGANVPGHLCYASRTGVAQDSTPPAAVGIITPLASYIGGGGAPACRIYSPATLIAASQYLRPLGVSQVTQVAASTNAPWAMVDDVDGEIVVGPNAILFVAANVAAGPGVCTVAISWEEVPIVA